MNILNNIYIGAVTIGIIVFSPVLILFYLIGILIKLVVNIYDFFTN